MTGAVTIILALPVLVVSNIGRVAASSPVEKCRPASDVEYAYITMAYDAPQGLFGAGHMMLHVLPLARILKRLSSYPLLVLSNVTKFPDGTRVRPALCRLHAFLKPVHDVPYMNGSSRMNDPKFEPFRLAQFWKIQIWRLTNFKKLIWLDADMVVYRSIDWVFQLSGQWAMKNSYWCNMNSTRMCGGLIVVEPSENTYRGIVEFSDSVDVLWEGEQLILHEYFAGFGHSQIQLLDESVVAWGHCLRLSTGIRVDEGALSYVPNIWHIPAVIHKSSMDNQCFTFLMLKQLQLVEGQLVNICHHHPLGAYWRDRFCEAVAEVNIADHRVDLFCDDAAYYLPHGGQLWSEDIGRPLVCMENGGVYIVYETKTRLDDDPSIWHFGFCLPKRFVSLSARFLNAWRELLNDVVRKHLHSMLDHGKRMAVATPTSTALERAQPPSDDMQIEFAIFLPDMANSEYVAEWTTRLRHAK